MKTITLNKLKRVDAHSDLKAEGIVALQVVEFTIDYFGNKVETAHDTKIMEDGRQIVIGGCGFIPDGFEVN
jgi:hypothetical protein